MRRLPALALVSLTVAVIAAVGCSGALRKRQAMPEAVANTYLLAGVLGALFEYEACAAMYDDVVKRGGAARESMLNRTVCLTRAAKRPDAIVSATALIDSPGILRGEAYFWRGWNEYHGSVRRLESELGAAQALELDNPTRQRRIDNLTEAVDAETLQLARAACNVAYSFGRAGSAAKGIPFADKAAAAHKDMAKLAAELLEILKT